MPRSVTLNRLAQQDLDAILEHIAQDSISNAEDFIDRIEERCLSLKDMPFRGRPRRDLPGEIRELVFEGRVVIVYSIGNSMITVLRILYGGRGASFIPSAPAD